MRRPTLPAALCLCAIAAAACNKSSAGEAQASGGGSSAPASSSSHGASDFATRGGDACGKYLTADVVASILDGPTGPAKKLSAQSCSVTTTDDAGSITITLNSATPQSFDAYQKYLVNPKPLAGVGDKAVQSMIGISSIKGTNTGCDIDAGGAPGSLKLRGEALGQKLGAICNAIYADAR
jgi:hypothetical protein